MLHSASLPAFAQIQIQIDYRSPKAKNHRKWNTKFTTNKAKSIKVKYNKQQDNTIQSYSRLQVYNAVQYSEWHQQGRLCQ